MLTQKDRKMKKEKYFFIIVILLFGLVFTSSCKRNGIEEPSPFGPSTYNILLHLEASPNVLFAGNTREMTTITATLKRYDSVGIANTTVHFDIRDALGNKLNVGFFEGNEAVKAKVTDANGMTSVGYYGPFSYELNTDTTVYIMAIVSWEGKEFISELAPIYIIRDAADMTFTLIADPNVLWATENRPQSQIKAYFKTADGIPLAGRRVYFTVLSGPGVFADNTRNTFVLTDANGYASITYWGPTKYEINRNMIITVQGQPETTTPFYIHLEVDIRINRQE